MIDSIETERLILREIDFDDAPALFEMDSNPEVLKFIGIPVLKNIDEVINLIKSLKEQYQKFSIGRWAVVDKKTNQLLGWAGLKFHTEEINGYNNFYELGYRFLPQFWGKGFATESSQAWMKYAFEKLKTQEVFAMTDVRHHASKNVLKKLGFTQGNTFEYPHSPCKGDLTNWFSSERTHK